MSELAIKAAKIASTVMTEGNNCCESILMAANTAWNLDISEDVLSAGVYFRQGMGSGCTCGALVGMVMASGIRGIEVIISDGGSKDKTREICAAFPVRTICSPPGRGAQLNSGAKAATGDVLFFIHADSKLEITVFDTIVSVISTGKLWGCCTLEFDDDRLFFKGLARVSSLRMRFFGSCYGDQGIYCERKLFDSVGGFSDYPLMEDVDLSRKLRKRMRPCLLPERIITSSRRFLSGGPLNTLLKMQIVKLLFALGVNPVTLRKLYKPVSK